MYTFQFVDGVLSIKNGDTVVQYQPLDPRTQEPWADAATAEAWAKDVVKDMQGTLSRKITVLGFVRRFNLGEHSAILAASQTNPTVRAIYDRLMLAKFIDLDDPEVEQGLMYYVQQGLVTEERVVEIITGPVVASELP